MRHSVFSFLFLLVTATSFAQELNFTGLGSSLNLPSEETYNIMQDSKGYIWICTENGLCCYNWNNVKIYDKRNGLPENAVYFISEDKQGVIHLLTSQNRIMRIENGQLKEEPFSKEYVAYLANVDVNLSVSYLLYIDEKGDYLVSTQGVTYKIDHNTHSITNLSRRYKPLTDANYIVFYGQGQNHLFKNVEMRSVFFEKGNYNVRLDLVHKGRTKRIELPFEQYKNPDWRIKIGPTINGYTFFYLHTMLIRVDEDMNYQIYEMPGQI